MKVVPVITGIGLVTALGRSVDQTWQSLLAGRHITDHARVEASSAHNIPRVASLGIEAADQAIAQAGWDSRETAVICCTSKGPVESWLSGGIPTETPAFGLADLSAIVARHTGFTDGPRLTLSAACGSGLHGLIRAAMMIQSGQITRALVVAAEASVHPLFVGSFRRLGVLAPEGNLCRPFDSNRHGFLMSDAAAAVCVEAANPADPPDYLVAVDRFAIGGDATHLTGSDPDGKVLKHLLQRTIDGQPVDLVHAHGTGTIGNDRIELSALEDVLAANTPVHLYSHKAALGHSLGASGLVAVVLNCLMHRTSQIPGNVNTLSPLSTSTLRISHAPATCTIHRSLIHAAGFGGPTAVVALRSR